MSKSFSLVVRNTPSQNLVSSNHVYVDEKIFDGKVTYVQIRDAVFLASPHPKAEPGSICLNRIQRTTAHASVDRPTTVELYVPPKHNFALSTLKFEVDFLNTNTVLQNEVDAKQLADHIAGVYVNQVFKDGQKLVIAFEGNMLLGTISSMEVFNTEAAEQGLKEIATIGMMMQSTKVILSKPKTSQIQFVNMESTAMNNDLFKQVSFETLGIGGLDAEIGKIFRRAFASRIFPPDIVKKLGITHVKGLLLFGPPGCGKTLMARQIGKMLNCHEPKVINGPEILNKYVGQSEENIRKLFEEAEAEYAEKGDNSDLHLIIFDEIDAICKQRGSTSGGTGVNDSVVNQLLSKIDGVNALNNILIIGMTNRLDMIDEALLRPGRFEVQMEIGLPDEKGRAQIIKIHTENMRKNNMLAQDVDIPKLSELTKNYSGAELAGLVRSATSFAMNRQVDYENIGKKTIDTKNLKVSWFDFEAALEEVKPAFGVSQNEFESFLAQGLIDYGPSFVKLMSTCRSFINQVKTSTNTNVLSMLLEGAKGSGKTTLAAHLAVHSGYPYVKIISPDNMVGYGEQQKCSKITKIFMDAYKSPLSIIVLDELERLIEYVDIGPRFSNIVLQTILVLVKKQPPKGRKLFIIGTTSQFEVIRRLEIHDSFNIIQTIPRLKREEEIEKVLLSTNSFEPNSENLKMICKEVAAVGMSIKDLLLVVEAAKSKALIDEAETTKSSPHITHEEFVQAMADCGQGKEDLLSY